MIPLRRAEPQNQCLLPPRWQSQGDFARWGLCPYKPSWHSGASQPLSPRSVPPSGCARCMRRGQDTTPALLESLLPLPCSDGNSLPDALMLIKRKCINPQTPPCLPHPRLTFKTTNVFKTKAARNKYTHNNPTPEKPLSQPGHCSDVLLADNGRKFWEQTAQPRNLGAEEGNHHHPKQPRP